MALTKTISLARLVLIAWSASSSRPQAPPAGTPSPAAAQKAARRAKSRGDYKTAAEAFRVAQEDALASKDNRSSAQAAIDHARSLEQWVNTDPTQQKRLDDAVQCYQHAIKLGDDDQKAFARNSGGAPAQTTGESIQTFQEINMDNIAPSLRFVYLYNYGRALEKNTDSLNAYGQYRRALDLHRVSNLRSRARFVFSDSSRLQTSVKRWRWVASLSSGDQLRLLH